MAFFELRSPALSVTRRQFGRWARSWTERGMSRWHDMIEWVGGYPFEVAKPHEIFNFDRGYRLDQLTTASGGHGCNEFVFRKTQ